MDLHFRIHTDKGVVIAATHYAEDAAFIVPPDGTIRHHRKIVWREDVDGVASESADACRELIWSRLGWAS